MKNKRILSLITAFLFCFLTCIPAFSYAAGQGDIVTESYDDGGLVFTPAKTGVLAKEDINTNGAGSVFTTIRNTSSATIYTINCEISSEEKVTGLKAAIYASGEENSECTSVSEDALNKSITVDKLGPGEILYVITLVETEDGFESIKKDISYEFTYVGVTDKSLADETDETEGSGVPVTAVSTTETDSETKNSGVSTGVKVAIAVTGAFVVLFDGVVIASLIKKRNIKKKEDE